MVGRNGRSIGLWLSSSFNEPTPWLVNVTALLSHSPQRYHRGAWIFLFPPKESISFHPGRLGLIKWFLLRSGLLGKNTMLSHILQVTFPSCQNHPRIFLWSPLLEAGESSWRQTRRNDRYPLKSGSLQFLTIILATLNPGNLSITAQFSYSDTGFLEVSAPANYIVCICLSF
jgi:hypothetical protein